jgi:rod shape-determining protein MreD
VTLYLVVPLLVLVTLLQTTIVPKLAIWGVFPNLPALVVVSWGLLRGTREGVIWGFIAGVAVDLFSGAPFGAATLALMAVGFLSGIGHAAVFRARIVLLLATMFLVTIIYGLIFLLVLRISGQAVLWLDRLVRVIVPSAALNTVLMPLAYLGMRILHNRFSREEMEW